ncbi:HD domain-containing protein [Herbiconiux liangxiaofengii]|uniref:HD domain-containing protein n=1 Tax=Herbiconiux liangxiaofengii TaxID=3342795 RepID=UPI0035B78949
MTPLEMQIVDHPAFQRLREILQLGLAYLVFPGATHRRYEHAIGTLHAVTLMMDAIDANLAILAAKTTPSTAGSWIPDEQIRPHERILTRLGALLHDIGHLANGHTFEDELGYLTPHDGDERLRYVFDKTDWRGGKNESLRTLVNRLYNDVATQARPGASAADIIFDIVSKDRVGVLESPNFRTGVSRDLIGNTFCADLLDYLHRDWLHIGKLKFPDLRLLEYLEIRINASDDTAGTNRSRVVINLRGGDRVRTDAVTAVLELLESRYQLAEIALFHRAKLSATAMLERVIAETAVLYRDPNAYMSSLLDGLIGCDDLELLSLLEDQIVIARAAIGDGDQRLVPRTDSIKTLDQMLLVLRDMRTRNLHKLEVAVFSKGDSGLENRMRFFSGEPDSAAGGATKSDARGGPARRQLARDLEELFELPLGSVAVYCPRSKMNAKVAEVRILIGGEVKTLAEHEEDSKQNLTGGHLAAQKERFKRLWRLHVAISADARAQLEERKQRRLFKMVIEYILADPESDWWGAGADIARLLATTDGQFQGRAVRTDQLVGARNDDSATERVFANRTMSIANFFSP